jgi:hypothetical protein
MKTNFALLAFTILLAGCQAASPPAPPPVPIRAPIATANLTSTRARAPEVVKTYLIGAYVDPVDPTLRHEAHTVQRIEAAAYWDLRPLTDAPTARPGQPAEAEQPQAATVLAKESLPAVVAAPPPPPPVELSVDPEPALMPNADGVIDLTAVEAPTAVEVNPFAVRTAPTSPPRTIELRVTGIVAGARPCAIVNGQLIEPGGAVEGLMLQRIEPTAVVFTLGRHRLRAPLTAEPIRVRTTP